MFSYSGKGLGEGGRSLLNVQRGQKMSDYALLIRPTRFTRSLWRDEMPPTAEEMTINEEGKNEQRKSG